MKIVIAVIALAIVWSAGCSKPLPQHTSMTQPTLAEASTQQSPVQQSPSVNPSKYTDCADLLKVVSMAAMPTPETLGVAWASARDLGYKYKPHDKEKLQCETVQLLVQTRPVAVLQKANITPEPDWWHTQNMISYGQMVDESPYIRWFYELIDRRLKENMITVTTRPLNEEGGWIPEVTVHSNCTMLAIKDIVLKFEIYDSQNNLVWDGNMLIPSLRPGATYTHVAAYNPAHHYVSNNVQSEVQISEKTFYLDKH
jgi:hypothetical protein